MVSALHPVGGSLGKLDSLQECVTNLKPFMGMCAGYMGIHDVLREVLNYDILVE